ncbi:MAG: hypothetical protein GXO71_06495 [Caldiserica bacterium]|nr:hypothetical protein [Caldisericota bacterium]
MRRKYATLLNLQNRILQMSERNIEIGARIASHRLLFSFLEKRYRRI